LLYLKHNPESFNFIPIKEKDLELIAQWQTVALDVKLNSDHASAWIRDASMKRWRG
jgi:hypothetical protein